MSAEIDRLEIAVEASASKANQQLDMLAAKLNKVAESLMKIDGGGLASLANGLERLTKSMQGFGSVKTADFARLSNNMSKLENMNFSGLNSAAVAMSRLARGINATGGSVQQLADLSAGIASLGSAKVDRAITNLPKLASGMQNLMTTLSKAPAVSGNLIQMTNALASLSAGGSKVGSAIGSLKIPANNSGGALKTLKSSMDSLCGSMGRARKESRSLSQVFGSFYANCFLLIRGIKKLGSAITESMDYVETYNYFEVTMNKIGAEFGGMYANYGHDSAEAYASSFADRMNELTKKMTGYKVGSNGELFIADSVGLGLDPQKIMDFQASIGAVTNSVGLIGETSINTSKALSMLSADLSSLKNVKLETVMTNLQSGLIGQSRALYKYGIDITNATLQTYALKEGIGKAVSEMTQAEKMQLRLIAILDQSKVAWGDQANTIGTVANQYRVLQQQMSNLARIIGNLFLPIVSKVLPVVNGLVIAIQRLFSVLGFKLFGDNWLKDTMEGIGGGYSGGELDDLAGSAEDAEGALDNANSAAKKLKTTTLGIDELNINSPQEEGGGSGGSPSAGGIDLSDAIGGALAEYESVWDKAFAESENRAQEWVDKISGFFKKIADATKPFQDAVKRLWDEGLSKLASFTWTALEDFYHEFLVPIGTWAFGTEGTGLTRLVDIINNSLLAIDWERLNISLKNFWIAIEPYAEQFGEGLIDFFEDVAGLAVDVINAFPGLMDRISAALKKGNPESARKWGYALGVLGVGLLALKGIGIVISGLAKFGTAFKGLADGLGALFGSGGIFAKIGGAVSGLFAEGAIFGSGGALASLGTGPLIVLAAAIAAVALALVDLWKTSEQFRNAVGLAFTLVKNSVISAFDRIKEAVAPLWDSIKNLGKAFYDFYESSGLKWLVEQLASFAAILIGIAGSVVIEQLSSAIAGLCKVLGGLVDIVSGALKILTGLLTADFSKIQEGFGFVGEGLGGIFSGIGELLFGWIADIWTSVCGKFKEPFEAVWSSISAWWKENIVPFFMEVADWFSGIWDRITGFFSSAWDNIKSVWNVAASWFKTTVTDPIVNIFSEIKERIGQIFEGLWMIVRAIWTIVSDWFSEHVIQPVAEAFAALKDSIVLVFTQLWEGIVYIWELASTWFSDTVITPISEMFTGFKETAFSAFSELWTSIQGVWSKVCTWFTTNIKNPLVKIFDGIAQSIKDAFDSAWTAIRIGITAAMNTAIGVVESAINWIIEGINKFIGGFSAVVRWAADILGEDWSGINPFEKVKFDRINIDAFAEGGFPNTGELFMARENGITEMVGAINSRPAVANNDQIVEGIRQGVYEAVSAAMAEVAGRNQEQSIIVNTTVEMDGRAMVQQTDEVRRRMGYNFQPV